MDNLLFSVNAVLPLFLVMAAGYFLQKKEFFSLNFLDGINKFCFAVALPALLFKNAYQSQPKEIFSPVLIEITVLGILGIILLSCLIVPRFVHDNRKTSVIIQGIYRSNMALFGLPLAMNIFGDKGVAPMSILLAIGVPLFNIMAVIVLSYFSNEKRRIDIKKLAAEIAGNKLIWGTVLGLILAEFDLKLPVFLERSVFDIAATATPLAMLSLGGHFKFNEAAENIKYTLPTSFLRLIAVPFCITAIGVAAGLRGPELGSLYIIFAAPAATTGYIMAQNMGSDGQLAGQIVVVTTMLSLFTVFGGVYILKALMLI